MNARQVSATSTGTPVFAILIVLSATLGFVYAARTNGLFACQASDRDADQYIGICNVKYYGDYDHGAFWFGLEPDALAEAARADVLFLGNSRLQYALSTRSFLDWADSRPLRQYLLGFSHSVTYLFMMPLLDKLRPSAGMYVLNIDGFFEDRLSGPANNVVNESGAENRYRQKRTWQAIHKSICGVLPNLCGNSSSYTRERSNGVWRFEGVDPLARWDFSRQMIAYDPSVDEEIADSYEQRAREFIEFLGVESECLLLTLVPNSDTTAGTARTLAQRLGIAFVAPELPGLKTFDGSHLAPESAERWSNAFVAALDTHVNKCFELAK